MAGCSATAERVRGHLVRLHPAGGEPYDAACVVAPDWGRWWWRWWLGRGAVAVVKGYVGPATFAHGRAVDAVLRELGYRELRYERRDGGRRVVVRKL